MFISCQFKHIIAVWLHALFTPYKAANSLFSQKNQIGVFLYGYSLTFMLNHLHYISFVFKSVQYESIIVKLNRDQLKAMLHGYGCSFRKKQCVKLNANNVFANMLPVLRFFHQFNVKPTVFKCTILYYLKNVTNTK